MKMQTINCVVVGDSVVGKTCLLTTYTTNTFPEDVPATVFDNYEAKVHLGEELYTLRIFDTSGDEEISNRFRPMIYPEADVFLVCFSIASPASFENARHKWIPDINRHSGTKPFLIVGTKADLRDNQEIIEKLEEIRNRPVSKEQGERLGQELKAVKYVECSALTQVGLTNAFEEVIMAVRDAPKEKKKKKEGCGIS